MLSERVPSYYASYNTMILQGLSGNYLSILPGCISHGMDLQPQYDIICHSRRPQIVMLPYLPKRYCLILNTLISLLVEIVHSLPAFP
jgi:hypothetical protein